MSSFTLHVKHGVLEGEILEEERVIRRIFFVLLKELERAEQTLVSDAQRGEDVLGLVFRSLWQIVIQIIQKFLIGHLPVSIQQIEPQH